MDKHYEISDDMINGQLGNFDVVLLNVIYSNDYELIKEQKLSKRNLNYLLPFQEVDIDSKISPLILACHLGRVDIVRLFLQQNKSLDLDLATEESGLTPLCVACSSGNFEILKILVDNGAEVNKPTRFNHTPLICCFSRLDLQENVYENQKICFMMADFLLQNGADINWIIDKNKGYTLLMQLVATKMEMATREIEINQKIIKYLLENGANRMIKTRKDKTAYDLAIKHCNGAEIRELIQNIKQKYFYNVPHFHPSKLISNSTKQNNTSNSTEQTEETKRHHKTKSVFDYLIFCNSKN